MSTSASMCCPFGAPRARRPARGNAPPRPAEARARSGRRRQRRRWAQPRRVTTRWSPAPVARPRSEPSPSGTPSTSTLRAATCAPPSPSRCPMSSVVITSTRSPALDLADHSVSAVDRHGHRPVRSPPEPVPDGVVGRPRSRSSWSWCPGKRSAVAACFFRSRRVGERAVLELRLLASCPACTGASLQPLRRACPWARGCGPRAPAPVRGGQVVAVLAAGTAAAQQPRPAQSSAATISVPPARESPGRHDGAARVTWISVNNIGRFSLLDEHGGADVERTRGRRCHHSRRPHLGFPRT